MDNLDSNQTGLIPSDGITLPTGPPLTLQQLPFLTPPMGIQAATFTPAQVTTSMGNQLDVLNTPQQQLAVTIASTQVNNQTQQMPPFNLGAQNQQAVPLTQQVQFQNQYPLAVDQNSQTQLQQLPANPFLQLSSQGQVGTTTSALAPTISNPTTSVNQNLGQSTPSLQNSGTVHTPVQLQLPQGFDTASLAAYLATLANANVATNAIPLSNLLALNNALSAPTPTQLLPNALFNPPSAANYNSGTMASPTISAPPVPGSRAYDLLAVHQTRKLYAIKTDVDRMKHLKAMKLKVVGKTFKPLNYRYASFYRKLEAIPGWFSSANKEKLLKWGIRGAELFRQTLLLEIEGEMLKIKGKRDVLVQDEQNGSMTFPSVALVRKDLRI